MGIEQYSDLDRMHYQQSFCYNSGGIRKFMNCNIVIAPELDGFFAMEDPRECQWHSL
jgi:hypothetical protein